MSEECVYILLLREHRGKGKSMRACVSICVVRGRRERKKKENKITQRRRGTERSLFCRAGAKIDKGLFGFCMIV